MKKLVYIFAATGLLACGESGQSTDGEFKSKLEQEVALDSEEMGLTTLRFDKMEHDFGDARIGQDYTYKFKVTNTGKKPLIIEDAKASCGCTVPDKPENPIQPGKSDEIVVTFTPKPGQDGITSKTVTVMANTDPKTTMLTIKANVLGGGSAKQDESSTPKISLSTQ